MDKVKQTTNFAGKMFVLLLLLLLFIVPALASKSTVGNTVDDEIVKRGVTIYGVVIDKKTEVQSNSLAFGRGRCLLLDSSDLYRTSVNLYKNTRVVSQP